MYCLNLPEVQSIAVTIRGAYTQLDFCQTVYAISVNKHQSAAPYQQDMDEDWNIPGAKPVLEDRK